MASSPGTNGLPNVNAAGARKGADPPRRPDRTRTPGPALGADRQDLHVRYVGRPAHAGRPVRRPPPTAGAALHARAGLGAGLQELLLHGRPHRQRDRAPGAARRHLSGWVAAGPLQTAGRGRRSNRRRTRLGLPRALRADPRSPMRSVGSTQFTAKACRWPPSRRVCYRTCWAGRLRN
jgi:hypothetical protein